MEGTNLQLQNEKDKLEKVYTNKELEVVKANLRAWNCWGRTWRLERKKHPSPRISGSMEIRTLTYQNIYLEIMKSFQQLKDKSIVDVGCGASDYLKWFCNDCKRLVGVDVSIEMLKLCRENLGKSIELIAADASHLPFKDEAFDISMTFQALHHSPSWKKGLKRNGANSKKC